MLLFVRASEIVENYVFQYPIFRAMMLYRFHINSCVEKLKILQDQVAEVSELNEKEA